MGGFWGGGAGLVKGSAGLANLKPCPICTGRRCWFDGREAKCPGGFPRTGRPDLVGVEELNSEPIQWQAKPEAPAARRAVRFGRGLGGDRRLSGSIRQAWRGGKLPPRGRRGLLVVRRGFSHSYEDVMHQMGLRALDAAVKRRASNTK